MGIVIKKALAILPKGSKDVVEETTTEVKKVPENVPVAVKEAIKEEQSEVEKLQKKDIFANKVLLFPYHLVKIFLDF